MFTKFVEATNGEKNWGKFMVLRFGHTEHTHASALGAQFPELDGASLLATTGWSPRHIIVFDLQTGEGARFLPGGYAHADLNKHKVWVCPLFEPFLEWLYRQDLTDLSTLPAHIDLPNAPFEFAGYRRKGTA